MILLKSIRFIHAFSYLTVTCQLMFYMVVFSDAMKLLSIENFLELRKIIDPLILGRNRVLYLTCLVANIGVILLAIKKPNSAFFITSLIALVCVVIDITLALKGNARLNTMVNTGVLSGIDSWETLRMKWLNLIHYRGLFTTAGMICILIGFLWDIRSCENVTH